ncbi:hypothetical protein [Streptomyces sp. NPDC059278]|uniref:hypothetical protein n=1 Tax=Streptomyces sp. NPDC059278 TaxID=3346801 RepID=UPI0036768433
MYEDRVSRVMVRVGCFMIIGVPLIALASCAFSGSTGGHQPSVRTPATPAAETPPASGQSSNRNLLRPTTAPKVQHK